ncbi:MAG: hypothetical protein NTW21_30795 [Verrucomicrobia bacterium]|nr:hypothetical protein [Verrucomicrobiota bacterium]
MRVIALLMMGGAFVGATASGAAAAAPQEVPLNYQPAGMGIGDTWFLQRGDTTHVFHQQNPRPGTSCPPEDNGAVAHAISKDLIHWQELPVAIRGGDPKARVPYDRENAIFTGSVVEHEGVIYNFYCANDGGNADNSDRTGKPNWRQSMNLATSKDGIHFEKYSAGNPLIEPTPGKYYNWHEKVAPFPHHARDMVDCRDMLVLKDPNGQGWLGYVVMRRQGQQDAQHSACFVLCRSKDLLKWEVGDPVCTPNRFNCFEVPDVFCIDGRWFMLALTGEQYGPSKIEWNDPDLHDGTIVFEADSPYGPFVEVRDNLLIASKYARVEGYSARTVERNGERLMFYTHNCYGQEGKKLSLPVKLVPRKDKGLVPKYWPGCDRIFVAKPVTIEKVELAAADQAAWHSLAKELPSDFNAYMLQAKIQADKPAGFAFGLSSSDAKDGFQLLIDPVATPQTKVAIIRNQDGKLLTDRWCALAPGKPHHLRLLVNERLVTVYLDDELMINYYLDGLKPGEFALTAHGKAVFTDVDFRPGADETVRKQAPVNK